MCLSRMTTRTTLSSVALGLCAMALPITSAVHCGTDPAASPSAPPEDASPGVDEATTGESDAGVVVVESNDGGTIDSGRDAASITVCGGEKGDPTAVPLLEWKIYSLSAKYAVELGVESETTEPIYWSSNDVVATGTRAEETAGISRGVAPYTGISKTDWTRAAMPETDVTFTFEKRLGWSNMTAAIYDLATNLAVVGSDHFRVTGAPATIRIVRGT